jgi:putative acetyltransferase
MPDLVVPTTSLRDAWLDANAEWGPGSHEDGFGLSAADDVESAAGFAAWVARLREQPDCAYWWILDDGRLAGGIALRTGDDEFVRRAGHVGFGIRPSARRRGLATWALHQVLDQARTLGMDRLLLVCEADNDASARTIERNAGVLAEIRDGARRYWITVGPAALVIRPERGDDHQAVHDVHARAFGDGEPVPALVDALRAAHPTLGLVATVDERVVGHVLLSTCRLDALPRLVDVLSLSPLGVLPEFQRNGIGTRLVAAALAAADDRGVPLVFLEGSPRYYGRRGFTDATKSGFRPPTLRYPPGAFQVATLSSYEDWMTGTFVYSDVFWDLDRVGLRGERLEASRSTP